MPSHQKSLLHGRVLVVDDNDRSRTALGLIAEYDGHDVRQTSVAAALAMLNEFRPHVVLLDPDAPLTPSFSEALAGQGPTTAPSIILTSTTAPRLALDVLASVAARVTRPFDFVALRALVAREVARFEGASLARS